MAGFNESNTDTLIFQYFFRTNMDGGTMSKLVVAVLMTSFCTYVNCVMLFALSTKRVFKETPRYILFAHMLLNDSIQLFFASLLYIMALAFLKLAKALCSFLILISTTTFRNAPLNLAVMSLERYVAIRFPLRHAEIVTHRRIFFAIGFIWFLGSVNVFTDVIFVAVMDPNFLYLQMYCSREQIFIKPWQIDAFTSFNVLYFVSVTIIILFTYISIMVTARSVSSNNDSVKKAHRTVLLHLIQLGLCLNSFLFGTLERAIAMLSNGNVIFVQNMRYLNYLFILILPRCLSPLIYGIRDEAVRPVFKYYFCRLSTKFQNTVTAQ